MTKYYWEIINIKTVLCPRLCFAVWSQFYFSSLIHYRANLLACSAQIFMDSGRVLHFRFSILSLFLPILVNHYLELYFRTDSGYSISPIRHWSLRQAFLGELVFHPSPLPRGRLIRHLVWQIEAIEMEDITWPRGDTNFIFECWKYLSRVSGANEWEILSAREDKTRIPKRPSLRSRRRKG